MHFRLGGDPTSVSDLQVRESGFQKKHLGTGLFLPYRVNVTGETISKLPVFSISIS
jgi:hypothetical protein